MKIENYGKGERCLLAMRYLLLDEELTDRCNEKRIILLPIPSARDGVHITGTDKLISELLMDIREQDFVVGYNIPDEDKEIIYHSGGDFFDAALDEVFLLENSNLSALGALGYILQNTSRPPADTRYGIVGYGRIAGALSEMLMYLGGKVRIYTSNNLTRLSLSEYGVDNMSYDRASHTIPDISDIDILINTAPTPLEATFEGGRIPKEMTVIELASGNNFEGVAGVIRLPSIPERFYPRAAARIYYEAIKRALMEDKE